MGTRDFKPFDCVGTANEVKAAFLLAEKTGDYEGEKVMEYFKTNVMPSIKDPDKVINEALATKSDHNIPKTFLSKKARRSSYGQ